MLGPQPWWRTQNWCEDRGVLCCAGSRHHHGVDLCKVETGPWAPRASGERLVFRR
jgi:hypothetical protein